MSGGDSVMFSVHIAIGNSQEEAVSCRHTAVCVCVCVCVQLYMRMELYCQSVFLAAPKEISPTAPFPAGGSGGKGEEEKTKWGWDVWLIVWTLAHKDHSWFCWLFDKLWIIMLLLSVSFSQLCCVSTSPWQYLAILLSTRVRSMESTILGPLFVIYTYWYLLCSSKCSVYYSSEKCKWRLLDEDILLLYKSQRAMIYIEQHKIIIRS